MWEINGKDRWGNYPIDDAGTIQITPIGSKGRGNLKETPTYDIEAERKKGWWIFEKKYVVYPRGTNKLLKRTDKTVPAVDMSNIEKMLKATALRAYTDETKISGLEYLSLALLGALFFFLVVMPNFK